MAERNITDNTGGLHLDSSAHSQPKGTYRFGLNLIDETDQGDNNFGSNEESNEAVTELPNGYTPVGKVYAGKNRIIHTLKGWNILLQVCYDLRFPVFSRNKYVDSKKEYTAVCNETILFQEMTRSEKKKYAKDPSQFK